MEKQKQKKSSVTSLSLNFYHYYHTVRSISVAIWCVGGCNANFFEQMAEDLSNFERYLRYRRPEGHVFIQQKDKTFVWVPDGKGAFYTAQVLGEEGDNTKVLIQETGQVSYIAV